MDWQHVYLLKSACLEFNLSSQESPTETKNVRLLSQKPLQDISSFSSSVTLTHILQQHKSKSRQQRSLKWSLLLRKWGGLSLTSLSFTVTVVVPDKPPTCPPMSLAWRTTRYSSWVSLSISGTAVRRMPGGEDGRRQWFSVSHCFKSKKYTVTPGRHCSQLITFKCPSFSQCCIQEEQMAEVGSTRSLREIRLTMQGCSC